MNKKLLGWVLFIVPVIICMAVSVHSVGWIFIPIFTIGCIFAVSIIYGIKLIMGW
jgi:hypothetical protein